MLAQKNKTKTKEHRNGAPFFNLGILNGINTD